MRIENLHSVADRSRARVAARVTWKTVTARCVRLLETDSEFASSLACSPNVFLTACVLPAMRHGEKRIFVDGEICPHLRNGLLVAMGGFSAGLGPHGR